ncbi:MAG: biotin--[acetyl-CoA-carboxylase] ligase [Gillisia sp.]
MNIIKVNATESSNTFARDWYQTNKNSEAVCIWVKEQTAGRGQRGASWQSNTGQNLTFSIVYPAPVVEIDSQFLLSQAVGLGVLEALQKCKIGNLNLKWPNDILSAGFKIGGILIENIWSNGKIAASVIGIGLNVNQISFAELPKASSMKLVSGRNFELQEVLELLLNKIKTNLDQVQNRKIQLRQSYEKSLFRKDKVSTFELPNGKLLSGIIRGVTSGGLLKVQVEDEHIRTFDLKELKLLF